MASAPLAPRLGYPTIKFFGQDKSPQEYQGGRDSGSIVSFATERWSSAKPPPEVRGARGQGGGAALQPGDIVAR